MAGRTGPAPWGQRQLRFVVSLLLLALGVSVLTSTAYRRRKIISSIADTVEAVDRFVDIGVTLKVVRADESGEVLIPGARKMVVLREYHFGGILDTKATPPALVEGEAGISANPQVWFCSEDQEPVILHRDSEPVGKLALGGMGAGKTTAGCVWVYLRWLENLGTRKEAGITAPTEVRLTAVTNEIFDRFPRSWWSYNSETKIVTMCDGFRWRGVSTHRQSEKQGSRVQQFNWVALFMDELQDQVEEFVNAQARLRSKLDGRAKRFASATAKDTPDWRNLKDTIANSGLWMTHLMLGPNSPFIHPDHWAALKAVTDDREYRRVVLAEDLPPESRLYSSFDRKFNLRPIPLGARKITSLVLSKKTGDKLDAIAMGHDPGAAKAGTVWADAYQIENRALAAAFGVLPSDVLWWVRAELFTLHATHEQHATQAMKITRDRFGCNVRPDGERAHVRCQPLGQAEDKPDLDVFAIWKRIGFNIKAAQYSKAGQGVGQIKKESRIGVVKTLFCNAEGKRRLFLECDDRGVCAVPQLLSAIETMERDHLGRPEHEEKNVKHDKSDLPAALGYLLWPFEKELALALRADIKRSLT